MVRMTPLRNDATSEPDTFSPWDRGSSKLYRLIVNSDSGPIKNRVLSSNVISANEFSPVKITSRAYKSFAPVTARFSLSRRISIRPVDGCRLPMIGVSGIGMGLVIGPGSSPGFAIGSGSGIDAGSARFGLSGRVMVEPGMTKFGSPLANIPGLVCTISSINGTSSA